MSIVALPCLKSISINFALPTLTRILRQGAKGDNVKALQKALNLLGFNVGNEGGDFGPNREKAVKALQTKAEISIDGEVYS